MDLPLDEAIDLGLQMEEFREQRGLKFATDFRPHSHHYYLIKQVRATPTESGVIDVGGARMCVFMTTWGDGFYPVFCDFGEGGQSLRVRIELGDLAETDSLLKQSNSGSTSTAAVALPKTNQCVQSPVRLHLLLCPPTVLAKQSTSFASGDLTG